MVHVLGPIFIIFPTAALKLEKNDTKGKGGKKKKKNRILTETPLLSRKESKNKTVLRALNYAAILSFYQQGTYECIRWIQLKRMEDTGSIPPSLVELLPRVPEESTWC